MYDTVMGSLITSGTGATGALNTLATNIGTAFTSIVPVAVPVVGAIAVGFFAISVLRGLLHA